MAQVDTPIQPSLTPRSELLASLEKHNASFTTLLSLIPAQFYIQPTQEEADSKWLKNKKRKTGEEIKEHKRKNLAEKLDPSKQKTTADIMFASDPSFTMDLDASSDAPSSSTAGPSKAAMPAHAPLPPTTSISDLRKRLAGKLAGFRSKRGLDTATGANAIGVSGGGADAGDDDGGESDDTTSRDALEAESRRRRGEIRDKRRRERKEQRRAEKAQNGPSPLASAADRKKGQDGKKQDQSLKNVPTAKTQLIVPQNGHGHHADSLTLPHIALPSASGSKHKHVKGSSGLNGGAEGAGSSSTFKHLSNPAHALASLQKHDKHLAGMDDDRRAEAVEQERWAKALHRAEGGKVVDSEKILKKAVKRVEKNKSKSGKEWNERKKQLSDAQAASIKKRNDNIANRAQARRDKKLGKKKDVKKVGGAGAKKGKSRPGFEGKKGGDKGKGKK